MPWDLDMLYMPVTHWSGVMNFQNAISQHQEILREFQSRARELMDLLFTQDQLWQVVGELAARENPPGWPLTFVDVDEAMWNYHPRTASGHRGAFYKNPSTHSAIGGTITRTLVSADHEGMARWIEDFVLQGYGYQQLAADAQDAAIPNQPTAVAVGDPAFPIDDLVFRAGPFSDPQGVGTFGGMKWRVAEVAPQSSPPFDPESPRPFEVNADWESEELATFQELATIPPEAVKIGGTYRVRVRMKDNTSRWSHWSLPIEFTTGEPLVMFSPQAALRITEIMYHPPEGSDYEFIELQNVGAETLDLSEVSFTRGIEFRFAEGDVPTLAPGEFVLVVKDRLAFSGLYDTSSLQVAGEFSGNLENAGEAVTLTYGRNAAILDFSYSDDWQPLTDGYGWSLVAADPLAPADAWGTPAGWKESAYAGGSPGAADGSTPPAGRQRPGDSNQDASLDISDAVSLLLRLFLSPGAPPCDGLLGEGGNVLLLDVNGDGAVDLSDAVYLLGYLFRSGPSPVRGARCILIPGCPDACGS
jgi:hypothetical protein